MAEPREIDIGASYLKPSDAVVTPHIKWMKPAFPQKLRVLFIGSRETMREIVELAQRLDMDWTFAPFRFGKYDDILVPGRIRGKDVFYKDDMPGDRAKRLELMLRGDYDLMVFGEFAFRGLPLKLHYQILKKVKEGTGMLRVANGGYSRTNGHSDPGPYLSRAMKKKVPADKDFLTGIPWQALPAFREFGDFDAFVKANFAVSVFGNGRIVSLTGYAAPKWHMLSPGICRYTLGVHDNWYSWRQVWPKEKQDKFREYDTPVTDVNMLDYDYNLAFVIKAMLYAADRLPALRLTDEGEWQERNRAGFKSVTFGLAVSVVMENLRSEFVLRDRDNRVYAEGAKALPALDGGTFQLEFSVTDVPAGEYFADLWIKTERETVAFGSRAIRVTSPVRIASLTTGSNHYKVSDTVTGTARIEAGGRKGLSLRLRQTDTIGRRVVKESVPVPADGKARFKLSAAPRPLTVFQRIDAELIGKEGKVLDCARAWFTYSDLDMARNKMPLLVWDEPSMSYVSMLRYRQLWKNGVDQIGEFFGPDSLQHNYFGSGPGANWQRGLGDATILNNIAYAPPVCKVSDLSDFKDKFYADKERKEQIIIEDSVRYPSLNDQRYLSGLMTNVVDRIADHYGKLSCSLFIIDQESTFSQSWARMSRRPDGTGQIDYSSHGVRYFRQWLKETYGTIEKLNEEYESTYKTFDEVPAVFLEDAVRDPKLRPLWADFRMSMDSMYAGFYRSIEDRLKRQIPGARLGICYEVHNGWRSLDACDYSKFDWMTYSCPYHAIYARALPDMGAKKVNFHMDQNWGYAAVRSLEAAVDMIWRGLLKGGNTFHFYRGDTGSFLANDLTFYPDARAMFDAVDEIRGGLGDLLLGEGLDTSQVGILYSAPSVHRWMLTQGKVPDSREMYQMYNETCGWWGVLRDHNIAKSFVSYRQLQSGVLAQRGYQALILPFAQAMSRAEIANIDKFVKGGGTVVADLRPGISDGHCKDYPVAPLGKLFGVTLDAGVELKNAPLTMDGELKGIYLSDPSLKLAGGEAHGNIGDAPALVVNTHGKGKAILLNFALEEYRIKRRKLTRSPNAPALTALAGTVFDLAGLKSEIAVTPTLTPHLEISLYGNASAVYVAMSQELPEPTRAFADGTALPLVQSAVTLDFGHRAHVYSARTGRYYGYVDSMAEYFTPGIPRVFSLLPYVVKAVTLEATKTLKAGDALSYTVRIEAEAKPVRHVVNVTLVAPDGKVVRYYGGNVEVEGGTGTGVIRTALNESPGLYVLRARDAATGLTAETGIEIGP